MEGAADLRGRDGAQVAGGLVQQQHRRATDDRPGEGDAPALAGGQAVDPARLVAVQTHTMERVGDLCRGGAPAVVELAGASPATRDGGPHAAPGCHSGVLGQVAGVGQHEHAPLRPVVQAGEGTEEHGSPGAGSTEHRDDLTAVHAQRQPIDHGATAEHDLEAVDVDRDLAPVSGGRCCVQRGAGRQLGCRGVVLGPGADRPGGVRQGERILD